MSRTRQVDIWSSTALVAALSQVESGWIDIGKRAPMLDVVRTSTGGTYVLEVDWSRNASAVDSTDTITTTTGQFAAIQGKARFCRLRVKNTHGTVAFSAHSTVVAKDAGTGMR